MTVHLKDSAFAGPSLPLSCGSLNPDFSKLYRNGQQRATCNRIEGHGGDKHQYIDPRDFRVVLEWDR